MIRHRVIWPLATLLWLALPSLAVYGQSAELQEADKRYSELRAQGRFGEILPVAEKVLELRKREFGPSHPSTGVALNNLGLLHKAFGDPELAEDLFRRALATFEKSLGSGHIEVSTSLDNLAELYQEQGRFNAAEPLYQKVVQIRVNALGPDHPRVGISWANLASLYRAQGLQDDAQSASERATAIIDHVYGSDIAKLTNQVLHLQAQYLGERRPTKGAAITEMLLVLQEQHLSAEHPHVAGTLGNLATFYRLQSRTIEAEALLKRALQLYEAAFGASHWVASSLAALGGFYLDEERYDEALKYYERSLEVENSLGAENLRVAGTMELYATALRKNGQSSEASQVEARAKTIRAQHE